MIVDCAVYREGQRTPESVDDLASALAAARAVEAGFVWLGLHEPTEDELARVSGQLGLHPLAVEDAVKAHQRPKLERYEDSLFVVLKTLRYLEATSDIESGDVMLFLGDSFVVTVRHGEGNPLGGVRQRLETSPDLLACGPSAVLYAVCDAVVDTYTAIAAEVEQDLEEVEVTVFSGQRGNHAERIYGLKREVLEFRRAALPLSSPMQRLAEGTVPSVHEGTRPFFRDVADHVLRVVEQVESADRLLTDILNANLAQVSVRQNDDMRRISAWVAIVAVPTLVAGIYGMNFEYMPELDYRWGYPLTVLGMVVVCGILYRLFKRSGWL
jgi:magnesium transporter